MDVQFKPATLDDKDTIESFLRKAEETSGGKFSADEELKDLPSYITNNETFLILEKDIPVGLVTYSFTEPERAYINDLVIHPDHQGKKIGKTAMKWLLDRLENIRHVDLVTHPHNTIAIILYSKSGFKISGWKSNYYGDGEPRIFMTRSQE